MVWGSRGLNRRARVEKPVPADRILARDKGRHGPLLPTTAELKIESLCDTQNFQVLWVFLWPSCAAAPRLAKTGSLTGCRRTKKTYDLIRPTITLRAPTIRVLQAQQIMWTSEPNSP